MLDQVCHPFWCVPVIFWGLCWLMLASCWFMLALCWPMLGSCWIMLALCWVQLAHVASSWLQVCLKMPKMGPKSLQEAPRASKMSQDGLKMAPKSIFLRYILLFFHNFHKYWKSGSRCSQGHFFKDLHPLILSILGTSWNKILLILVYAVKLASSWLKMVPCCLKMAPCCLKLLQLGLKLP